MLGIIRNTSLEYNGAWGGRQAMQIPHQVVIVGGGFGGLNAAQSLRQASVQVTLLDRRNFHLFQPLLYQVATGALSPANIAAPLRSILRHRSNVTVLLGEVIGINAVDRRVILADEEIGYDTLIVAAGVRHHYFGNDPWEQLAPGLKTIEDATEIRRRVLVAFENAERELDPEKQRIWLTFAIIGGGPTGVELAGAVGEIAHYTLRRDFRNIDLAQTRIVLLEGTDRILPTYPPTLSATAAKDLARLGVTVQTGTMVTAIQPGQIATRHGEQTDQISTHTILWAAGVQASPLGRALSEAAGVKLDRTGRVMVEPDLSIPGHPEIFVIGDLASLNDENGKPLPGVAQVAIQQGRYVANLIQTRLNGGTSQPAPFHYRNLGNMATIGRASAVADLGQIKLSGFLGWAAWLFIHLISLVQFENRLLVLIQWAFSYFTRNRAARLITGIEAETQPQIKNT